MTIPQPARTYIQDHVARQHTPGKRRVSIYWTWSYPWEAQRDPAAMDKAELIVCDNAEEVQHGTGDFINARKAGVRFEGKVFDLPDLVKGKLDTKVKAAGITMYRSAGTGLQDVVVAELAWRRATEKGLAVELPMQLFRKTSAAAGGRASAPAR